MVWASDLVQIPQERWGQVLRASTRFSEHPIRSAGVTRSTLYLVCECGWRATGGRWDIRELLALYEDHERYATLEAKG